MTRTTIRIDEHLMREVKQLAARSGRTVTAVIDDALRAATREAAKGAAPPEWIPLPTSGSGGLRPGVDLNDNAAMRDLMDEEVPLDKLR